MAWPVNNRSLALQWNEGAASHSPGLTNGLRAQVLRVRALAHEVESDDDLLGQDDPEDGSEDDLGDDPEGDLELAHYYRRTSGLLKRKHVSGELDNSFEVRLQRIRTHNVLHVADCEDHELRTTVDRLRALHEDDLDDDDSDLDLDASAVEQHDADMNGILNDRQYSRIRELVFNPTMGDFEHGRASLMRLIMEPNGVEQGVAAGVGIPRTRKRLAYTITCALKATNWFERSLQWSNADFRSFYRMSKPTFWEIVRIIEGHEKFRKKGRGRPQRPVHYQFGVFLLRYGCLGATARVPMLLTSIGEGTVLLYCQRVIAAVRQFGLTCVGWPTVGRKQVIAAEFQKKCGLNGVVGALDGVHFKLSHKPTVEGDLYINRKGAASITVQATCDHEGRLTSFQSGLPGSKPDTYVWNNSELCRRRNQIFEPGEFLLADGGYPLSPFVLIPFNRRERRVDEERKLLFNRRISGARVVIERTFGLLKGRFPALRLLGPVEDMRNLFRAVEALMVLHNVCYDLHDRADGFVDEFIQSRVDNNQEVYDYVEQGPDIEEMDVNNGEQVFRGDLREAGSFFWDQCMDIICPN